MKLTVFGPTGGTGEQVVRQALAAGHHVTAVARRPGAMSVAHPCLTVIQADVLDPAWQGQGIGGADAALSALGSRAMGKPTSVYSQGTAAVIAAMTRNSVTRFISVSAIPLTPDSDKSALERRAVHPLLHHFFGGGYDDMRRMEHLLAESQICWTVFRPSRLTNGPGTGRYRMATGRRLPHAWSISRADLAAAMLAAIGDSTLYRRTVTIAK